MTETQKSSKGIRSDVLFVIAVLVGIAALALVVLWLWVDWTAQLELELAKTALTALSVTVFGSLAALAIWRYQKRREAELEEAKAAREAADQKEREQNREQAEREIRAEENFRREAERLRDARSREDDFLRSLLQDTLRSYNRVKRIRRLLRAHTKGSEENRFLRLEVYDTHIQLLIDEQLTFEELKRLTAVQSHDRRGLPSISSQYRLVEKYLNKVVDEYEEKRYLVARPWTHPIFRG